MRRHRSFLVACVLFSGTAHAEDCWNGPNNISSQLNKLATFDVPAGNSVTLNFGFNAAWENEVLICDSKTRQLLATKGNFRHDRSDWVSPNGGQAASYTIAAFHKKVPMDDDNAFKLPWLQSTMKNLTPAPALLPQHIQFGFNDGGGLRYDNALVTVNYANDRHPRRRQ